MNESILVEVGNGEVELIIFEVNNQRYGVNVLKAKEIIRLTDVRSSTDDNKSILGITSVRDEVMTIIDLSYVLDNKQFVDNNKRMALVCEFNNKRVMFAVDNIEGIMRVKWKDIIKPDTLLKGGLAVGHILTEKGILLMLDFEKIITDINKEESPYQKSKEDMIHCVQRENKKIYLVDDSKTIRLLLSEALVIAGYKNVYTFNDGQEVLERLQELKEAKGEQFKEDIDLLITDVEMPSLDGHTLIRQLKEDPILSSLPIIIFSSLITEDLSHKGEAVGADYQISKPSVKDLIKAMDSFLL